MLPTGMKTIAQLRAQDRYDRLFYGFELLEYVLKLGLVPSCRRDCRQVIRDLGEQERWLAIRADSLSFLVRHVYRHLLDNPHLRCREIANAIRVRNMLVHNSNLNNLTPDIVDQASSNLLAAVEYLIAQGSVLKVVADRLLADDGNDTQPAERPNDQEP